MYWDRSSSYGPLQVYNMKCLILSHSASRVPASPAVLRRRRPRNRSQHEALPRGASRRTGAEWLSLALGYLVGVHIMAQGGSTRLRTLLQNSSALLKDPKHVLRHPKTI